MFNLIEKIGFHTLVSADSTTRLLPHTFGFQISKRLRNSPLQMNGMEGEIAQEVKKFALFLEENLNLPVFLWDERLSSSAMENFLIKEVDLSRKKRAKILDASAAAYILQGALDALSYA